MYNYFLGQNESSQPEKKSTIADINQQKSVKGPLDNLELLVELFPNVEKTSLIDSLLSSHGKYIHKLGLGRVQTRPEI